MGDWVFQFEEDHSLTSIESCINNLREKPSPLGHVRTGKSGWFAFVENHHVRAYVNKHYLESGSQAGEKLLEQGTLETILAGSRAARQNFNELAKRFKHARSFSNAELSEFYLAYSRRYGEVLNYFEVTQPYQLIAVEAALKQALARDGFEKVDDALILLTTPTDLDIIKREEMDFLDLASGKASEENLMKHAEKHPWLFINTDNDRLVADYLNGRLKQFKITKQQAAQRKAEIAEEKKRILDAQQKLLQKAQNPLIGRLSGLVRALATDRLELKSVWAGAEYLFIPVYAEIAKRIGVTVDDLKYGYRVADITASLASGRKLDDETVCARKSRYAILSGDNFEFFEGNAAAEKFREIYSIEQKKLLKGKPACLGKATGRVRLVEVRDLKHLIADIEAFKQGEVLVTTMTQPSMMVLAKKAAAIVTNEGGITSHAAIIAREFNIPCVVGTDDATHVLKTGDLVEVDANKGTVKKIG